MVHINPDAETLAQMADRDPDEPVIMVNLVKFLDMAAEGFGVDGMTGQEAYYYYGKKFEELDLGFVNEILWAGPAETIIGDEDWDTVTVIRYPTRGNLVTMFKNPDFQALLRIRAAGLKDSRLIEMSPTTA